MAIASQSSMSKVVTREHACSVIPSTYLPMIGGDDALG
jgi:hypothetical protein